jgi:hypothetical protein
MGELVVFKPKAESSHSAVTTGMSAEILFFTGVRIVRLETAGETPQGDPRRPTPSLRKRRRRAS